MFQVYQVPSANIYSIKHNLCLLVISFGTSSGANNEVDLLREGSQLYCQQTFLVFTVGHTLHFEMGEIGMYGNIA